MMIHPRELKIDHYTYLLPEERIAKYPLHERDGSKLVVYGNGKITEDIYKNLATHRPAGSLMVFNQTKVVNARLLFRKPSGGVIEVFCLGPHHKYPDIQTAMLQKNEVLWECLVGGAAKWKPGMVLQIANDHSNFILSATIVERTPASFILKLGWDNENLTFAEVLHAAGRVPLPPYLNRDADKADESRYQTVFAKEEGSVAAPTAGLHFTDELFQSLADREIRRAFVTLHVGAATFKPVKSETMAEHTMHEEWIEVQLETVQQLLAAKQDRKIIAVGTTSLRTLESLYWIGNKLSAGIDIDFTGIAVSQWEPYETACDCTTDEALQALAGYLEQMGLKKLITRTQILIAPGYDFRIVDGLVTNFHQPKSTLLLLVAALIGDDWRRIYEYALANGFRFLSYGDGGLLWR